MANRSNSRYTRSSFQGLSVIEGQRKDPVDNVQNTSNSEVKLYKDRSERRRRTSSLAQSHQIRDIIAKTVEELSRKGTSNEGSYESAEEILNRVLAQAKESGYSADRIFSILSSSSINESDGITEDKIQKNTFISGLRKLSKGIHMWRKEDLNIIADKFDINGDGFISLAEFQHYCYHEIPSVAWRAERQRKQAQTVETPEGNGSSFDIRDIKYGPGSECHRSSKLFWKINVSVEIVLRYCTELGVISMQIYSISTKQDYKSLYVNKSSCAIDQTALKDAIILAEQTKDDKSADEIEWTFYANYLIARLQILKDENDSSGFIPSLVKLHGDGDVTLEIDKPHNMNAPAKKYKQSNTNGKSLEDEFQSKVRSFEKESRSARTSRQTAEKFIRSARNSRQTAEGSGGLQEIMRQALEEIEAEAEI